MVLELRVLHVLDEGQVELGYEVLVHVEQDVTDHVDAHLGLFPGLVVVLEELVVVGHGQLIGNWLQQLHCSILDIVVEHLAMLVEHEVVGCAVQLFIAERGRLLVVNLVDGFHDGFPVLLGLGLLQCRIAHLVPVNQELVRRQT